MYWGTDDGLPPPDTPRCGFDSELCPSEEKRSTFTLGYLAPTDIMTYMQGSAISIAIENFHAKGWLKDYDFK